MGKIEKTIIRKIDTIAPILIILVLAGYVINIRIIKAMNFEYIGHLKSEKKELEDRNKVFFHIIAENFKQGTHENKYVEIIRQLKNSRKLKLLLISKSDDPPYRVKIFDKLFKYIEDSFPEIELFTITNKIHNENIEKDIITVNLEELSEYDTPQLILVNKRNTSKISFPLDSLEYLDGSDIFENIIRSIIKN